MNAPLGKDILVVDDQLENRQMLRLILLEAGFVVREANCGQAALEAVGAAIPELILLDVNMPDMDGYAVCQALKREAATRDVPVIFLSALKDVADKLAAFEAGGVDYVSKPYQYEEVLARVGTHLTLSRQRQQIADLLEQLRERNLQLEQANRELERMTLVDGLTGIANRRHFDSYLEVEWRRLQREREPLTLLLGDIDLFKRFNDTYGHHGGDACLKQVAQVLAATVRRPADLAARYGGEELAAILPAVPLPGGLIVANRFLERVRALQIPHAASPPGYVSLSVGVASIIPHADSSPGALIEAADRALYLAKSEGRDQARSLTC